MSVFNVSFEYGINLQIHFVSIINISHLLIHPYIHLSAPHHSPSTAFTPASKLLGLPFPPIFPTTVTDLRTLFVGLYFILISLFIVHFLIFSVVLCGSSWLPVNFLAHVLKRDYFVPKMFRAVIRQ